MFSKGNLVSINFPIQPRLHSKSLSKQGLNKRHAFETTTLSRKLQNLTNTSLSESLSNIPIVFYIHIYCEVKWRCS